MKIRIFLCRRAKISQDLSSKRTDQFEAIFMRYPIRNGVLGDTNKFEPLNGVISALLWTCYSILVKLQFINVKDVPYNVGMLSLGG